MSIYQLYEQKDEEELILSLRRHPIVFVKPVVLFVAMAILPILVVWQLLGWPIIFTSMLSQAAFVLLASAYYLGAWLFFLSEFTDYYLDITIITSGRIIDVNQRGLFSRAISELNIGRVQDVHSEIKGIIGTIFNYGLVIVETAGEVEHFRFEEIRDPHAVRAKIIELADCERELEGKKIVSEAILGHDE